MIKKIYTFGLLFFLSFAGLQAQTSYYYYYKGEKQYLELNTKQVFVSKKMCTFAELKINYSFYKYKIFYI